MVDLEIFVRLQRKSLMKHIPTSGTYLGQADDDDECKVKVNLVVRYFVFKLFDGHQGHASCQVVVVTLSAHSLKDRLLRRANSDTVSILAHRRSLYMSHCCHRSLQQNGSG